MTLQIRALEARDEAEWRRMWTAYLQFYESAVPEEVYQTSFQRLLSGDAGEYRGLIAQLDGKPVGLTHFLYHRSMWTIENTCYLMDLFCDPAHRGKGVGRALIEAVHAQAKKDGAPSTYWMTQELNYKGRMLYDQVATKSPFLVYEKND